MSRSFPEPAQIIALYRLHRGIDYWDVAEALILAWKNKKTKDFDIFIVSGETPFLKSDCAMLFQNPAIVIRERFPQWVAEFSRRGWKFPERIDTVYDSSYARNTLGWKSKRGPMDVFTQLDYKDFEVLPPFWV